MKTIYNQLTPEERDQLALWKAQGTSNKEVARRLGCDSSTIGRELKRNSGEYYVAITAQLRTEKRQREANRKNSARSELLYQKVVELLRRGWAPEQIAGRLNKVHGAKVISHEAIYQYIYAKRNKQLGLSEYLPRKHKKRRNKGGRKVHRTWIPDRVSIHERPDEVGTRVVFGHREGDSLVGKERRSGIHTGVERKSRYVLAYFIETWRYL